MKKVSTKLWILQRLEEHKGTPLSGEALAEQLGISRAAVWKAMAELRKEGHQIQAVTNQGYCLTANSDIISAQGISPYLNTADTVNIHVHPVLESTNLTAKKMALDGAGAGTLVIAEEQTKGRGRLGRSFYSPSQQGIYMSLILTPAVDNTQPVLITAAAAVAVARAIERILGKSCQIKWVNDLYLEEKKICGILTEAVTDIESCQIQYIILGIGINFRPPEQGYPDELKEIVGALFPARSDQCQESILTRGEPAERSADQPANPTRNQLIAEIVNELLLLNAQQASRVFMAEYKKRSLVIGRSIRVHTRGENQFQLARALDIDNDGGLLVQYQDGTQETLRSGEISIRLDETEPSSPS